MKLFSMLFATLLLLGLVACDQQSTDSNSTAQQTFEPSTFQTTGRVEQLKSSLLSNPNDFNALSELGDLYFESSQYFEAIQTYDKAIAVNPMCADCWNDKGLALFYIGDPVAALDSLDKAVEIQPDYTHAWLSKGFILTSEGRYEEAVAPLHKVKELDATGALALEADKFLAMGAENKVE